MEQSKVADIRAQLEEELNWRQDEIRLLHNQLSFIESEEDRMRFRKPLIVMLYSHYEGFCSTAFQIYIQAVNDLNLKRKHINYHLAVSSLLHEFNAYDSENSNPEHYKQVFKNKLPEDKKLRRFARQVDFVKSMNRFWDQYAYIPDEIVNTESNLWPLVLKKLLYRLGLPPDHFKKEEGKINELMNRRNSIAHGDKKASCDAKTYKQIESSIFRILDEVIKLIMDALLQKDYLISS